MEKKITKRDNFNEIIKIATELGRQDLVAFATYEIELLDRKKANEKKTENQKANDKTLEVIVATLTDLAKASTITEIQNANAELAELSNQKISALLKKLVDTNVVEKTFDKRKAYFKLV